MNNTKMKMSIMTDKEILTDIISNSEILCDECGPDGNTYCVESLVDLLLENHCKPMPCAENQTIYRIVKCCGTNTGYSEFFKPNKEFDTQCEFLDPQAWYDDSDSCKAIEDRDEGDYCSLYLKIFCNECKERLVWQRANFTLAKRTQIYGTPMFDPTTKIEDTYYLTQEDVEAAIERIKNGNGEKI